MPESIRIAVAGAGLIGKRHIALVACQGLLSAVVDPAPAGKLTADQHGVPHYPSLEALFAEDKPDGVVLATPNTMHVEHALACVEAGVPALVEKPLADNATDGAELVAAAWEAGVPLLVGHHRRYNPIVIRAREVIDSGALGRLVAVHVHCWFFKPEEYFEVAWRHQPGAGPVLINLIHDIDLMRHLCGDITSVQAAASNGTRSLPVEDTAGVLVRFANGAIGTMTVSDSVVAPWSWEMTAAENPAYPSTGASCYQIGGTHGSLSLPDLVLWQNCGQRSWLQPLTRQAQAAVHEDPLAAQIRHFAEVVRGTSEPVVPGFDGLQSLKAVEAVLRAAETGSAVDLS